MFLWFSASFTLLFVIISEQVFTLCKMQQAPCDRVAIVLSVVLSVWNCRTVEYTRNRVLLIEGICFTQRFRLSVSGARLVFWFFHDSYGAVERSF